MKKIESQLALQIFLCPVLFLVSCRQFAGALAPGVTPRKIGWGVRPASQNPYPIYDQNLRFLPYLQPDQKFDVLFMTIAPGTVVLNIIYEGLWLIDTDEKVASSKKTYPAQDKSAKTISYL